MTMTITQEQVQAVLSELEGGNGDICETYSRNRRVALTVDAARFMIFNSSRLVCETSEIEVAVLVFNYYGARELSNTGS